MPRSRRYSPALPRNEVVPVHFCGRLGCRRASFPELARQAAAARDANQQNEAIRLYRECVRLNPSWAEGWWYLGTLLYDGNQFAGGRDALARFVQNEPKSAPGWAMLGLCEFETAQYEPALAHLQRGLTLGLSGNPQIAASVPLPCRPAADALQPVRGGASGLPADWRDKEWKTPDTQSRVGHRRAADGFAPRRSSGRSARIGGQVGRAVFDTGARHAAEAKRDFDELVAKYPDTPEIHYLYGGFLLLSDADGAIREWKREIGIIAEARSREAATCF